MNVHFERLTLAVVAERPVAEHLEARQVGGVADLVDVDGAQAALNVDEPAAVGCGAPEKYGTSGWMPAVVNSTELVARDQRAAGDLGVAAAGEEVDVGTPKSRRT